MKREQSRWALRRLRLRRGDGQIYLDRWGFHTPWFGIYLHKMTASDPSMDVHDHPWPFISIILRGGYTEKMAEVRNLMELSSIRHPFQSRTWKAFQSRTWKAGSVHTVRLDEAHTIIDVLKTPTWTLVLLGKKHRAWGFYEYSSSYDGGPYFRWVPHTDSLTERRQVYAEIGADDE